MNKMCNHLLKNIILLLALITLLVGCNTDDTSSKNNMPSTPKPAESQNDSEPKPESEPEKPEESLPEEEIIEPITALIGKWTAPRDVAPTFRKEGIKIKGALNVTHYLQFTKNGKYALYPSPDEMKNAVSTATKKAIKDELQGQGLTEEDFSFVYGMSLDTYVDEFLDSYIISYRKDGEYTLDGKKINIVYKKYHTVIDNETITFEFVDIDTLKVTDENGTFIYKRLKI